MRKSLRLLPALLVCFCFILPLQAQTTKGSVLLGGGLNFSLNQSKSSTYAATFWKNNNLGLSIKPEAGYFLADNLAFGTALLLNYSRNLQGGEKTAKAHGLGISPLARYYKFFGEKLAFFGQGGFGYARHTDKSRDLYSSDSSTNFHVIQTTEEFYSSLMPGLSYFPMPWLGFQFTLGELKYGKTDVEKQQNSPQTGSTSKWKTTDKSLTADFGLGQATLGINFFLTK